MLLLMYLEIDESVPFAFKDKTKIPCINIECLYSFNFQNEALCKLCLSMGRDPVWSKVTLRFDIHVVSSFMSDCAAGMSLSSTGQVR